MSFTKFLNMLAAANILTFDEVTGFYYVADWAVLLYKGSSATRLVASLELVMDIVVEGEALIVNKKAFCLDDFDVYRNGAKLELQFG
jgi:hypothetical protein